MSESRSNNTDECTIIVYSDSSDRREHVEDVATVKAWYQKYSGMYGKKDAQTQSTSSTAAVLPQLATKSSPQPSRGLRLMESNIRASVKIPRSKSDSRLADDECLLLDKKEMSIVNSRR